MAQRVERRVRNGETIGQRGSLLNIAAKHFLDQEMKRQPKNNWEKTYLRQGYNSLLSYTPQVDIIYDISDFIFDGFKYCRWMQL